MLTILVRMVTRNGMMSRTKNLTECTLGVYWFRILQNNEMNNSETLQIHLKATGWSACFRDGKLSGVEERLLNFQEIPGTGWTVSKHRKANKEKLPTAKETSQDAQCWGWPAHRDRLPVCPRRPCPNATLRYSRTNGKVFPIFPTLASSLLSQVVHSSLPSPLFWSLIFLSVTRWPTPSPSPTFKVPPPPSLMTSLGHPGRLFLAGAGWQSSGWAQAPLPSNAATQAARPRYGRRAGPG